jgi:hypothetical protein
MQVEEFNLKINESIRHMLPSESNNILISCSTRSVDVIAVLHIITTYIEEWQIKAVVSFNTRA